MIEPKRRRSNVTVAEPEIATATFYGLISAVALCGAGVSAWFIVSQIDTLARYMAIEKAYYVLLVLVGLGAAAFLFGAMRSYGHIRGRRFGSVFEFGGPAAGALFITLAGMGLTRPAIPFDLTIRLVGMDEISTDDRVEVDLGSRHEMPQIGPIGDVIIRDVAPNSKATPVSIRLISEAWRLKDPTEQYLISTRPDVRLR